MPSLDSLKKALALTSPEGGSAGSRERSRTETRKVRVSNASAPRADEGEQRGAGRGTQGEAQVRRGTEEGVGLCQVIIGDEVGHGAPSGRKEQGRERRCAGYERDQHRKRRQEQSYGADNGGLSEVAEDHEPPPLHAVRERACQGTEETRER